jgi:threonine dehydrogenase-like Zn-dependent dehydrogenase
MRAAQLVGPHRLEFVEIPAPVPLDGEALVRLSHLSVCGSDLRYFSRVLPEEQYPLEAGKPCHECAGIIEQSNSPDLKPGQRVIVLPKTSAGLAEYVAAPANRIIPVPDSGDLANWLMCQHMGTVMYSCGRIGSVLGKTVVVLGQGAIGLNFTTMLSRNGAQQIIVTDLLDDRLRMASYLGATHTINPARSDLAGFVREITDGTLADIVIEAAGRPETVNQIAEVLRLEGTAILFGQPLLDDVFPIDYDALMGRMATIISTIGGRTTNPTLHISNCVDLVSEGRLDLSHLLTHRLPFDEVQEAFDLYAEKPDGFLKVVIDI